MSWDYVAIRTVQSSLSPSSFFLLFRSHYFLCPLLPHPSGLRWPAYFVMHSLRLLLRLVSAFISNVSLTHRFLGLAWRVPELLQRQDFPPCTTCIELSVFPPSLVKGPDLAGSHCLCLFGFSHDKEKRRSFPHSSYL